MNLSKITMQVFLTIFISMLISVNLLKSQTPLHNVSKKDSLEFVIIDPMTFDKLEVEISDKYIRFNDLDESQKREFLNVEYSELQIYSSSRNNSFKIPSIAGAKKNQTFKALYYYVIYRPIKIFNVEGKYIGQIYFGYGIIADFFIKVKKKGVSIASLEDIGIQAKKDRIEGNVKIKCFGIKNPNSIITEELFINLNESTVLEVIKSINTFRFDQLKRDETKASPMVFGVKPFCSDASTIISIVASKDYVAN